MEKILVIHHSGHIGGAGVSLLHVLDTLKKLNYIVEVVCPVYPNEMKQAIEKKNLKVIPLDKVPIIEHYSGLERNLFNLKTIKNYVRLKKFKKIIEELIVSNQPDIVLLNSMTLSYMGDILKKLKIKSVCFHRETYTKGLIGFRTKIIKNKLIKDFDKVVFISKYDMQQTHGIKQAGKVIYDKVIMDSFIPRNNEKSDKISILYLGGMSRLKGAHILIKALAKVDLDFKLIFLQYNFPYKRKKKLSDCNSIKEKTKLLLGIDYSSRVLALIDKYNLWESMEFHETQHDVTSYYKQSDFVVFPSTAPHQSRPIYEAGAAKIPVIITHSKNIEEFVENNNNGLTFKNKNHKQLSKQIKWLAENNYYREKMGLNNYYKTEKNHNFSDLEEELHDVLKFS